MQKYLFIIEKTNLVVTKFSFQEAPYWKKRKSLSRHQDSQKSTDRLVHSKTHRPAGFSFPVPEARGSKGHSEVFVILTASWRILRDVENVKHMIGVLRSPSS